MVVGLALLATVAGPARGCPFCGSVEPPWVVRREQATTIAWGELFEAGPAGLIVEVRQVWQGEVSTPRLILPGLRLTAPRGSLILAWQETAPPPPAHSSTPNLTTDDVSPWQVLALDEARLAYLARMPKAGIDSRERLIYAAGFLEHPDPWIAADAYATWAVAPFNEVRVAAAGCDGARLASWLRDPGVPSARQGLYGLLLGLVGESQNSARALEELERAVWAEADDFRAGYDGLLAGYLWCGEREALHRVAERIVDAPQARQGDLRHAWRALVFFREGGPDELRAEVTAVARGYLRRREFVAEVLPQFAPWRDADAVAPAVEWFGRGETERAAIDRAVVGFLIECDVPGAAEALTRLRTIAPEAVAKYEREWAEAPSSNERQ